MFRTISKFAGLLVVVGLVLAVAPRASAQTATCNQTYTVQAGDWLSTIAQKYLGDARAYTAIMDATNEAAKTDKSFTAIADPNKIEVGQKLCIPAVTAVPGRELAGIYTTVGPAADASALVETLVLGGDGQVRYTLDYIGKASIDGKGTWKQEGDTVTVALYEQVGKPVTQTMTFTVKDGNLVATAAPNATYAKTNPDVAYYSGLYTSGRSTQDGSETLTALALMPDGTAQLTLSTTANPFILQTGTWTVGENPDTKTSSITVTLTKQGDTAIDQKYVFQANGTVLRGTEYDSAKWGTDLTFTKFAAPAEPQTPANSGGATGQLPAITGIYTASLPAADAIGRVITLDLSLKGDATLSTQFIGKGAPTVETGSWVMDAGNVAVTLGTQKLTFVFNNAALVLQNPVDAGYGSDGLTLTRVGTGNIHTADFDGVTFNFDDQFAKSAAGDTVPAVPVTEGPALGGATAAGVRFLFNGDKPSEFLGPGTNQVVVYKADDWTKLDPSTAKTIADLTALLKDRPADFGGKEIPVLPPTGALQVIRVQPKYLDFQNGSGVGFVTYYAQDASPITADRIFYTFQGLTTDGKYFVTVYHPVTTALLPSDSNTALGGQTYDEWVKQYQTYLDNLVAELNGLVPAAYTPNLTLIENLIQSIEVSNTTLQ